MQTQAIKDAIAESVATKRTVTIETNDHANALADLSAMSECPVVLDGNTVWGDNGSDDTEWSIRLTCPA